MKTPYLHRLLCSGGLLLTLAMLSCSHMDEPGPACGGLLEYDADSVAICFSDSAVAFVGTRAEPAHFNLEAYLLREYKVARDPEFSQGTSPYPLSFVQWKLLSWESRLAFLPYPYSHDIVGATDAEFMYLIATYPEQFGFGWTDTYAEGTDLSDPTLGHIWLYDDSQTIQFDGNHGDYDHYLNLLIYLR
ncbi:hypothetical protein KKC97_03280 [bacterium]|nr:hypothetical protein [bacterium]